MPTKEAVTILQIAEARLGRKPQTGADFAEADLEMLGGCQRCGASIACYNACPSLSGYWRCTDCIGNSGFATVEEAIAFMWPEPDPLGGNENA